MPQDTPVSYRAALGAGAGGITIGLRRMQEGNIACCSRDAGYFHMDNTDLNSWSVNLTLGVHQGKRMKNYKFNKTDQL